MADLNEVSRDYDVMSSLVGTYEEKVDWVLERPYTTMILVMICFLLFQLPWMSIVCASCGCIRPNLSALWAHERTS
jgi:hypothetical protein